ncbi:MAG: metallophosphoesterase [Flavipsychrobacter sp.]
MRLLHISDLHLEKSQLDNFKQFYLEALLKDIKEWNEAKNIDLILMTGDLVDKGGHSFKRADNVYNIIDQEFFQPLLNATNLPKEQLIFISGNHDLDDSNVDIISENGLNSLKNIDDINQFISDNKDNIHDGIKRQKQFIEFEKEYYGEIKNGYISNFESCFYFNIKNQKVGVVGLNSSWRCSTKLEKDKLLLGTRQILNAKRFFQAENTDFNIVLIHHPLDHISSIERHEINTLLQASNFNIVLSGHTHYGEGYNIVTPMGKLVYSVSKSAFSNPREKVSAYQPGYTIIDINQSSTQINYTYNFRKYIHARIQFDKDTDPAQDGKHVVIVPIEADTDSFKKYYTLTTRIYKAKQDNINTSLVTYNTDSIAPRDLDSIFVLPKLTEKTIAIDNPKEETKFYSIDAILRDPQNIIIAGDKETGKSTLLNKLYIDSSNFFSKYQRIPIKFNYSDLLKRDIKPLIKDFLNEPDSAEVDKLLLSGTILLLIDNYTDDDDDVHLKQKLKRFISDYSKCKIILTTKSDMDSLLTENNSILKKADEHGMSFKPLFIGSVGVKEFKELASRWFKNRDTEWFQSNLEKLIKVFEMLRIPRTFFSVSLYLWIIEKQENFKPINKANLVQQFLTFILEGLKMENAKAGSYNFDKKIEILSEIAYNMYELDNCNENYAITEAKAIECIQSNFQLNQLRYSSTEKLNELIQKGILIKDTNNNICFRYEAFFQFFLALSIDKIPSLKEKIFIEENFLSFIDELDYYTGRKRDDFETLDIILKRLISAYDEIDEFIKDNVDEQFPKEPLILKTINTTTFIDDARKNKPSEEQIEAAYQKQLEKLPIDNSIKAKEKHDYKKRFYKVLELTAKVLKNSENIKKPEYVNESLKLIINKAAKYGVYQTAVTTFMLEDIKDLELPIPQSLILLMVPLANQTKLVDWMGTEFLEVPLEKLIQQYLAERSGHYSEYQLYLTAFLYADMKFHDYTKYLDRCIDKITNKFVAELFFFKILMYYMFRPKNSALLEVFENQMVKLLVKAKRLSRKNAEQYVRSNIRKRKDEMDSKNGFL